jgi:hypothetical protein
MTQNQLADCTKAIELIFFKSTAQKDFTTSPSQKEKSKNIKEN